MKSGVSLAAPLKVCLCFWQFYSSVSWCAFLCVFPLWSLKFLLNLWLDIFHQFTEFAAAISSIVFLPPFVDSEYTYFGSFLYVPCVLSFYFNLVICFSLDILYWPVFLFNNPLSSAVLKPTVFLTLAIIFSSLSFTSPPTP